MGKVIGIRREDKNIWERRVTLIPEHVSKLIIENKLEFLVQPFETRAFADNEYENAGATLSENLSDASIILAVKEIPIKLLMPNKTYLFFSHTIKGQAYNIPLLKKLMELKSTLIDYEVIRNQSGRRLVFFGRFAGIAGMIECLYGLGKRFEYLGCKTPFLKIKQAYQYSTINEAKEEIKKVGEEIKQNDLPEELIPLNFGFTGYGNVSKGAQEIFDLLPHKVLTPKELLSPNFSNKHLLYKTVFTEVDMFEAKNPNYIFDLHDYFKNPGKYKSQFQKYLSRLDVLVNAIYWHDKCPRLITKEYLQENFDQVKLKLVTDITCDIDGAVEFTVKATEPDHPAFVYDPIDDSYADGFEGEGIVDITIDNLPTELPKDASIGFSHALLPFIAGIANADTNQSFEDITYPSEIKNGVVLYKGELTPEFKYLENYL